MQKYYVAYGSNINVEQMSRRCPGAEVFDTGILANHRLEFRGTKSGGHLNVHKRLGCCIPVLIWKITADDEKALDRYEGYPTYYIKKEVEVYTDNNRKIKGLIYVMNDGFELQEPSEAYVTTCKNGYKKFGFNEKLIDSAIKRSSI